MKSRGTHYYMVCLVMGSILFAVGYGTEATQFVRAYFTYKEMAYDALQVFEAEACEISYDEKYIVLQVTPEDIKKLQTLNFTVVPDPDYDIHHNRSPQKADKGIPGYPCYLLVEETFAYAESIVTALPDMATWVDAGDSWDKTQGTGGYDIMVLKLTNSNIPGPKPKLMIAGSIHAREYSTSELCRRFVKYLLENYGTDADATWMLDYHEFHALFYINPDGRKYAEEGQMWRKNTNADYCTSDPRNRGSDLNRNFERNWASSDDECGQTYSGSGPASEPETQAVQGYMQTIFEENPEQGIFIDLHCYGQIIYKPSAVTTLARKFSFFNGYDALENEAGMAYEYGYYTVGAYSCLFELGTAFFQDCDDFEDIIVPDNLPAFIYALKACRDPSTIPDGPDVIDVAITGNRLTATVDDTRYGADVTTHTIEEAEYYVGIPPWESGATPIAMTASDGSFDEETEGVEADIISHNVLRDQTTIYIRGKDADNNWGAVSAIFHDMTAIEPEKDAFGTKVACTVPNSLAFPACLNITVPTSSQVLLKVYSVTGKEVVTLTNNTLPAGQHVIRWNGKDNTGHTQAEGIYLYKLKVGDFLQTEKIVVVR